MKEEYPTITITKLTPLEKVRELTKNNCGGCKNCCTYEPALVVEKDIPRIAKHLELSEDQFKENYLEEDERFNTPVSRLRQVDDGACVFFNDEKCALHGNRPLHCKIGNCNTYGDQAMTWLMLNYFVNPDDPQSIREWAAHLKTRPTIPGGELHELVPDKDKLREILAYEDLKKEVE